MKRRLLLLLILCLQKTFLMGQIDTQFWFAAPEVSASLGDQPIFLNLYSYDQASTVTIFQPANGAFSPIVVNLPVNGASSVNLTPFLSSIESPSGNAINNNGLKIVATQPIGVSYEIRSGSNKEIVALKGSKGTGTEFYTPFASGWNTGASTPSSFSSFEIVATENNTTVLITPRAAITGHPINTTFSITLNEGQTYSGRDTDGLGSTSLSGSIISSNKPVSVTIFQGGLSNSGCSTMIAEQISSSTYIGKNHIIHKGSGINEKVYILAVNNNTGVTISNTGTTSALINFGETFAYNLTDTVNYIASTDDVYVLHVSGYGCELGGAQVPFVLCAGTNEASFIRPVTDSFALHLYTRSGFENQFTLNGNASLIPASSFKNVPGTSGAYKSALIYFSTADLPVTNWHQVANSGDVFGLGIKYGGQTSGGAFTYVSEFNSYPFVEAGANATVCANVPVNLNGLVGGGPVTGSWSSTGFGTFQNALTDLNNVYIPSALDTVISPIEIILTSTGACPVTRDTLVLTVEPAPLVNASVDQIFCSNNVNISLNGSVGGGSTTGIWSTLGTGSFQPNATTLNANYQASAADITSGSVTLVLTSTNNGSCAVERDTMVVTFTSGPTVDAGVASLSVCRNNPIVSLSGSVTGSTTTGSWTTNGTGSFTPSNLSLIANYNPSIADLNNGSVKLFLTSTGNGSCIPETDSIEVIFTPEPVVSVGSNLLVCTNEPLIQLNGSVTGPTSTGIWSGGNGTYGPNNSTLTATYLPTATEISSGTLFLTLTSTNNGSCNAEYATLRIDFIAPPFANFNFTNECLNEDNVFTDFSLQGFGTNTSWAWDFGDGNTSAQQNPTHTYINPGTYSVELITTSTAGCSDSIIQNVTIYPLPVAGINYTSSCSGTQVLVDFTDNSVSSDSINFFFWDFGGAGSIAIEDPSQVFTGTGTFMITHTISTVNGCRDTIIEPLIINPRPNAGFYYNTSNGLNIGSQVNFIDTSNFATSWEWDFDDNGAGSNLQDPSHVYFANGTYWVTLIVYDDLGCSDTARIPIRINTVVNEVVTLIPNAISPNGDGKNDVWKLPFIALKYPEANVQIFNRWGQRVFVSDGYTEPFDGTYGGELLPSGTYFYVLDLKDPSIPEIIKGDLLIIRE